MPDSFPTIPYPESVPGFNWVYILQSTDRSLYVGHTCNVAERLRKHRYGLGAKFTSEHSAPRLVYREGPMPLNAAVAREAQLKRWSRAKKEALIQGNLIALRELSRSRDEGA